MKIDFFEALIKKKINPVIPNENDLFGQFIGEWEFNMEVHETDGSTKEFNGNWLFKKILQGRAIQDVWMVPTLEWSNNNGGFYEYGTSIRSFDFKTKKWKVTWVGPIQNQHFEFDVEHINNEIQMQLINHNELQMKWVFYDIKTNMFQWRSEVFLKSQGKWFTNCHMSLTKN